MTTATPTDAPEFLNSTGLARRLGVSRSTVHRWRLAGFVPRPCYVDAARSLWDKGDIEAWIQSGQWGNTPVAKHLAEQYGVEYIRNLIKPTGETQETPELAELLDKWEEEINACEPLSSQDCNLIDRRLADLGELVRDRRRRLEKDNDE